MKHPILAAIAAAFLFSVPAHAATAPTQAEVDQAQADMRDAIQALQDFNRHHGDRAKWTPDDEKNFSALRDEEEELERTYGDLRDRLEDAKLAKLPPAERIQKKLEKAALLKKGAQSVMSDFLKSHPDRTKWTPDDEENFEYFRKQDRDADTQIDRLVAERDKLGEGATVKCQRVTSENVICDGDTYQKINKGVIEQLGQRLKRAPRHDSGGSNETTGPAYGTDAK